MSIKSLSKGSSLDDTCVGISRVATPTNLEKDLSLWETMKIYKKATFWSFVMCCTIIMDGYDGNMVPSFYALPVFQKSSASSSPTETGQWKPSGRRRFWWESPLAESQVPWESVCWQTDSAERR